MKTEAAETRPGRGRAGAVSLWLATPLALILMLHPALMIGSDGRYSHGLLMLVMLGSCAGFVHGVGFRPYAKPLRLVFSPPVVWPLLLLGYALLVSVHWR